MNLNRNYLASEWGRIYQIVKTEEPCSTAEVHRWAQDLKLQQVDEVLLELVRQKKISRQEQDGREVFFLPKAQFTEREKHMAQPIPTNTVQPPPGWTIRRTGKLWLAGRKDGSLDLVDHETREDAVAAAVRRQAELDGQAALPFNGSAASVSTETATDSPRTAAPEGRFAQVPLAAIRVSGANPRTIFDEGGITELAESLRLDGLLEPLLLRPAPDATPDSDAYELIAGERRLRALRLLGWTHAPSIIRDANDRQARRLRVIENLQRRDLTPIEEADGFQALIELDGLTPKSLAAELGKKPSFIYARLKLRNLPAKARQAVADGSLAPSYGELIGRLPSAEMRQQAFNQISEEIDDGFLQNFQEVEDYLRRNFTQELKGALFPQNDELLLPGVPTCKACPYRTGNNPEYEGRADICTKPACYQEKLKAWQKRLIASAWRPGRKVLDFKESQKILGLFGVYDTDKYLDLSQRCDRPGGSNQLYKDLLRMANDGVEPQGIIIAFSSKGEQFEVFPRKDAEPLLQKIGVKAVTAKKAPASNEWENKQNQERAQRKTAVQETLRRVQKRSLEQPGTNPIRQKKLLQAIITSLILNTLSLDAARQLLVLCDLKVQNNDVRRTLADHFAAQKEFAALEWLSLLAGITEMEAWMMWGATRTMSNQNFVLSCLGLDPTSEIGKSEEKKAQAATGKEPPR